ncbi:hypothetical protein Tco_0221232 [Tanacetum coccineum]
MNKLRGKDIVKEFPLLQSISRSSTKPTNNTFNFFNSRNKMEDTTQEQVIGRGLRLYEIDENGMEAQYSFTGKDSGWSYLKNLVLMISQLEQYQNHDEFNVFANERRHSEQPESINDTYVLEKDESNVNLDSLNICNNDNQVDQNAAECVSATNLDETNRALGEATSCRDSCLIALQNKQTEFEKYKAFNDRTIDYEILQTKLNETLGLLARKDIDIKEEMHEDFEYVESLEKEIDELELEKANFSNIYDLLLKECMSKDVRCSYLHSLSDLNAYAELQCLYLHKVKECECLAQKLSKQTESVNKEVHNKLLKRFEKLKCKDKNIAISVLKETSLRNAKEKYCGNPSSVKLLTEYQLADMFTKALPEDRFKYLVRRIGMRCLTPADLEVLTNETA